jgi:hypothetical protein
MEIQDFRVGQAVKFAAPLTSDEASERFAVVELRGDRVLVQCIGAAFGDWSLKPQMAYLAADLIAA